MNKPKTWNDMARMVFGPITDDECSNVLWGATCFPFGRPSQVLRNLRESFREGGGTVLGAICFAEKELEEGMAEIAKREADEDATS